MTKSGDDNAAKRRLDAVRLFRAINEPFDSSVVVPPGTLASLAIAEPVESARS